MDGDTIIRLADSIGAYHGWTRSTVSTYAAGPGDALERLARGCTITVRRATRIIQWFSDHWPLDLDWPSDIPRPAPAPDSPAAEAATSAAAASVSQAPEYRSEPAASVTQAPEYRSEPPPEPPTPAAVMAATTAAVAAVKAARTRAADALGDAMRDPDWDAHRRAQAEAQAAETKAVAAGMTLGAHGRIASPEALCLALGAPRYIYDQVVRAYADGKPRAHSRPRRSRDGGPTPTERMFTALIESGDARFAHRRQGPALAPEVAAALARLGAAI